MIELRTSGVEETRAVAAIVASQVTSGDVVLLAGDLGAGKTAFVQGFAAAVGVTETVTSPTFTLVHTYEGGRLTVHHADVYRLDRTGEVLDLALGELLDEKRSVVLVEWGDVVAGLFGREHLLVRIELGEPDRPDERRITITASGRGWLSRWDGLRQALQEWIP